jgi:hypothetical protein
MIGRVTWRGITLGTGTPYGITSVEGWEDVDTRADDEERDTDDGESPGQLYASARVVTIEGYLLDPEAGAGLVAALRRATPVSNALDTLTVEQHGQVLTTQARLRRRAMPQDLGYGAGWSTWLLQWRAPDPRRYSAAVQPFSVGFPVSTGGVTLPVTLPISLGQGSDGRVVLPNAGSAGYRPVLRVTGPAPGFLITDLGTGRRLRYEGTLAEGEFVLLDNKRHRVLLNGTSDRRGLLSIAEWIEVPGQHYDEAGQLVTGGTELAFTSLGADGTAGTLSGAVPTEAHW